MNPINVTITRENNFAGIKLFGKYDLVTFYNSDKDSIQVGGHLPDGYEIVIDPNNGTFKITPSAINQLNPPIQQNALPPYSERVIPLNNSRLIPVKQVYIPKCNHFANTNGNIDPNMVSIIDRYDNRHLSCNICRKVSNPIPRKLSNYIGSLTQWN